MKKLISTAVIALALALVAAPAQAGGSAGSFGLGAEFQLSGGAPGVSANFDAGAFHFGGVLTFADGGGTDDTDADIGGRFYYHLHATNLSDFGIGGQLGLAVRGDRDPGASNNQTALYLAPGFQFRAFISNNIALSLTAGITLGLADANGVFLDGQLLGGAGVHYYFF